MFSPQLVDVFLIHEDINLVFEFCETDLESILMEQSVILKPEHIKCHMKMLLEGLGYLHDNFVLHRVRVLQGKVKNKPPCLFQMTLPPTLVDFSRCRLSRVYLVFIYPAPPPHTTPTTPFPARFPSRFLRHTRDERTEKASTHTVASLQQAWRFALSLRFRQKRR